MIDVVANDEAAHLGDAARAADAKGKRGRECERLVILVNTDFVDFVAVRPSLNCDRGSRTESLPQASSFADTSSIIRRVNLR